uniref:diphthine methyl ester synthase n=1 Tax=Evadne anonyx TaxID=141404 RepID=A0A9N6WUZ8_9CRUS|nr:EOG090X0AVB [Evadne anonyx]
MLYLIGLGLGDAKDITVRGLEVVRSAKQVYLEAYTSVLTIGKEALEEYYGREVIVADREFVEQKSEEIIESAVANDVAFLVVGDPFGATTHTDLVLRAKETGVQYRVIHNASIMNAIGCCGLQLYSFGETISIPFWTETWKPDSFCDKLEGNLSRGLHTLCLLDIKVKEQTIENLMKGNNKFEPPRFMTVCQAAEQLMEIIDSKSTIRYLSVHFYYSSDTLCVGVARVGWPDQKIVACTLKEMQTRDIGSPLHSLVIVGKAHPLELDYLKMMDEQFNPETTN